MALDLARKALLGTVKLLVRTFNNQHCCCASNSDTGSGVPPFIPTPLPDREATPVESTADEGLAIQRPLRERSSKERKRRIRNPA
jgi:hypothetical protein